jgi:hypothetical protein
LEEEEMKMNRLGMLSLLVLAALCNAAPIHLTDDATTVGLWHMDGAGSSLMGLDDDSANPTRNNNLVFSGSPLFTGTGTGGVFDNANGTAVKFGPQPGDDTARAQWNGANSFAIDMWFMASGVNTAQMLFNCYRVAQVKIWNGDIYFAAWDDDEVLTEIITSGALTASVWQHVVASVTPQGVMDVSVYALNGSLIGSATGNLTSGTFNQASRTMYFGSNGGTSNFYTGRLDEVKVSYIPEPATLALLGLGGLLLRKKK